MNLLKDFNNMYAQKFSPIYEDSDFNSRRVNKLAGILKEKNIDFTDFIYFVIYNWENIGRTFTPAQVSEDVLSVLDVYLSDLIIMYNEYKQELEKEEYKKRIEVSKQIFEDIKKKQKYLLILKINKKSEIRLKYFYNDLKNINPYKDTLIEISVEDLYDNLKLPERYIVVINGIEATLPRFKKDIATMIYSRVIQNKFVVLPIYINEVFIDLYADTSLSKLFKDYSITVDLRRD